VFAARRAVSSQQATSWISRTSDESVTPTRGNGLPRTSHRPTNLTSFSRPTKTIQCARRFSHPFAMPKGCYFLDGKNNNESVTAQGFLFFGHSVYSPPITESLGVQESFKRRNNRITGFSVCDSWWPLGLHSRTNRSQKNVCHRIAIESFCPSSRGPGHGHPR
jgi:hypothetical protein